MTRPTFQNMFRALAAIVLIACGSHFDAAPAANTPSNDMATQSSALRQRPYLSYTECQSGKRLNCSDSACTYRDAQPLDTETSTYLPSLGLYARYYFTDSLVWGWFAIDPQDNGAVLSNGDQCTTTMKFPEPDLTPESESLKDNLDLSCSGGDLKNLHCSVDGSGAYSCDAVTTGSTDHLVLTKLTNVVSGQRYIARLTKMTATVVSDDWDGERDEYAVISCSSSPTPTTNGSVQNE